MKTQEYISVWLDNGSGGSQPAWIVSRDRVSNRGANLTSRTIACYELDVDEDGEIDQRSLDTERSAAIEDAEQIAVELGLPLSVDD